MTGPLRMSFEVACSSEHAFRDVDIKDRLLVAARSHREALGFAELTHDARNNRIRAIAQ